MGITKTKKDIINIIGERDLRRSRKEYWWEFAYHDDDDDDYYPDWREEYLAMEWWEINRKIEEIFHKPDTIGDLLKN